MADLNSTQVLETSGTGSPHGLGVLTPSTALRELWYATDEGNQLSQEQLKWLAGSTEVAGRMLQNLQTILMGAGCLILGDASHDGIKNGALQSPESIAEMLFMAEQMIDSAVGMIELGDAANFKAYHPLGREIHSEAK